MDQLIFPSYAQGIDDFILFDQDYLFDTDERNCANKDVVIDAQNEGGSLNFRDVIDAQNEEGSLKFRDVIDAQNEEGSLKFRDVIDAQNEEGSLNFRDVIDAQNEEGSLNFRDVIDAQNEEGSLNFRDVIDAQNEEGSLNFRDVVIDGQNEEGSLNLSLCLDEPPPLMQQKLEEGDSCNSTRKRRDRSKTIVTERKRRVRMKETLYELRSLVPNITKMDKASIIGDAVEYVRNLQSQAKNLQNEISMLEFSTLEEDQVFENLVQNKIFEDERIKTTQNGAKICDINALEIGNRRYLVTIECEKRDMTAVSLYAAFESLVWLKMETSNLSLNYDKFILSLTLNVGEFDEEMNAPTINLWIMSALLKEGFVLESKLIS